MRGHRYKRGLLFTLVVLALMEAVARSGRSLEFPGPFWELAVIHAALVEGLPSGLLSAALTILYAAYALALPGDHYFIYSDEGAQRLITQAIAGPGLALFVAYVRRHRLSE
jgi:hypothetical protein